MNNTNVRIRSEWLLHVTGIVAVIGCIAIALATQSFIANKTLRLRQESESIESLLSRSQSIAAALEQSSYKLGLVHAVHDQKMSIIPAKLIDSDVLTGLHRITDQSHCNLIDINPGVAQELEIEQAKYRSKLFQLQIEGSFGELYDFLASLPSLNSRYEIHRCRIGEPGAVGGACKMEIELRLLYDFRWKSKEANEG